MIRKFSLLAITILFLFLSSTKILIARDISYPPMAVLDMNGQLWLYGFGSKPQRTTISNVVDMAWSPDGTSLAILSGNPMTLQLLDATDMSVRQLNADFYDYPRFPISFSQDGTRLIYAANGGMNDSRSPGYWLGYWAEVFSLELKVDALPEEIGYVDYDNSTNGEMPFAADLMYWSESNRDQGYGADQPGFDRFLLETPFGILHTRGIWGGGVVNLFKYGSERKDTIDLPGHPEHVVASPDRTHIVGVSDEGTIVRINLQTLESESFSTEYFSQLLAWSGDENVYYVTRNHRKNLLDTLSDSQQNIFRQSYPYITKVPMYDVQIRVLNLEDGKSKLLYDADAYAIGRLMLSPDGKAIFFTQIPNMRSWIENLFRFPQPIDEFDSHYYKMGKPTLYKLSLDTSRVETIGTGFYRAVINFPAYTQQRD